MSAIRHTITRKSPKNTYNLKGSEASKRINDYNPIILSMYNANLDIQFVTDNSFAVAQYVASYITKSENIEMKDVCEEIVAKKKPYSFNLKCSHTEKLDTKKIVTDFGLM